MRGYAALLLVPLLLSACATPRDGGFARVQEEVQVRIGEAPRWDRISGEVPAEVTSLGALTADRAVQVALQNNPELQAAYERLGMARAGLAADERPANPRAEGELRFASGESPSLELSVAQDLTDLFYAARRGGAGTEDLRAAQLEAARAVIDLAAAVRGQFFRHQAAEQRVELLSKVRAAAAASAAAAVELHRAGNISDLALLREQAQAERAALAAEEAEDAAVIAREELKLLLGSAGATWDPPPRLPDPEQAPPPATELERLAVERSLTLRAGRHQIEAAKVRAGLSGVRGWIPEVEVGVAVHRDHDEWQVGPQLGLELPLFDQGQAERWAAASELARRQQLLRSEELRLRTTIRAQAARAHTLHRRSLQLKRVLLPLSQQILEQTQLEVNAMLAGLFDLLQAKREQVEAALAYLSTLERYWLARVELDRGINGGSTGAPAAPVIDVTPADRGRDH